jgi:hypothetical protein
VDDVNRIVESNEANNKAVVNVGTNDGPDLSVNSVTVKQAQPGKPLVVNIVIANEGSDAVPAGTRISATVYAIEARARKLLGYTINRDGLPAGSAMTLTVTGQADLAPGHHQLRAIADDVHRIAQLDRVSHQTDFEIDVPVPAAE